MAKASNDATFPTSSCKAIARAPAWPPPIVELGQLEMQSGRDARAADALRRAIELDPFNVRARNSLRLIEELLTYDRVESEHFIVRYRPGVDAVLAREMLAPLEAIHEDAERIFQHAPDVKTTIELMPDSEWFAVRISGIPQIHTVAACTGSVIAMEVPKIGKKHMGEYDWQRVLRHEYIHTITLSRTRNRIPHWFTEAAAEYFEFKPRDFNRVQLLTRALDTGTLFDMERINTAFVRPEKPTDRAQAYAQGQWMYEFIIDRWGESAPLQLMDLYAEGKREDEAMRTVLGLSQDEFHAEFLEWARADCASWGMLPEPSIAELRLAASLEDVVVRDELASHLAALGATLAGRMAGVSLPAPGEMPLIKTSPEMVEFWLIDHPDHPDLLSLRIAEELEFAEGRAAEEHVELLERYAEARPVDPFPHRELARLHLDGDEPARAIPHLTYLDERETYSPAFAVELAKRHAAIGAWNAALAHATRATRVAPFDAGHRELAAAAAIRAGDLETAEHHLLALADLEPGRTRHQERLDALRAMMAAREG